MQITIFMLHFPQKSVKILYLICYFILFSNAECYSKSFVIIIKCGNLWSKFLGLSHLKNDNVVIIQFKKKKKNPTQQPDVLAVIQDSEYITS